MTLAMLVGLTLAGRTGLATARPIAAHLIWAGPQVAYLQVADSLALANEDRVTFERRGKAVANGSVERVDRGGLVLVRLETGELGPQKHWKQIRFAAEAPANLPLPHLRLGIPSRSRPCAFFACAGVTAWQADSLYRADLETRDSTRLIRRTAAAESGAWPETLVIRPFDEAGDQEIALERGEIDAGIFWPGELSSRLREDRNWWSGERGSLAKLHVAQVEGGIPGDTTLAADLAALDRELFRGDLERTAGPSTNTLAPARPRLLVDSTWPGAVRIESWWNRGAGRTAATSEPPLRWRLVRDNAPPASTSTPLFGIHCPVVAMAPLRRRLATLGLDALVAPLDCPAGARP